MHEMCVLLPCTYNQYNNNSLTLSNARVLTYSSVFLVVTTVHIVHSCNTVEHSVLCGGGCVEVRVCVCECVEVCGGEVCVCVCVCVCGVAKLVLWWRR